MGKSVQLQLSFFRIDISSLALTTTVVMARPYKPIPRLSEELRIRYLDLKAKIQEDIRIGTEAFKRAGEHLLMIRQERLYREEYSTFEAFCRDVFGHSKTYA